MHIHIEKNKEELGRKASTIGAEAIKKAISENGIANIILATGASQFEMLHELSKETDINWSKVNGFHLDEYIGIPISHPASFRLYLWKRFISQLPTPINSFHFINTEEDPQEECEKIGKIISSLIIDVAFIGIGDNKLRIKWLKLINKMGYKIPTIIDPSAEISKYAILEKGSSNNNKSGLDIKDLANETL